jgi:hypothetical protein
MRHTALLFGIVALTATVVACPSRRAVPTEDPGTQIPTFNVPEGCAVDLSGTWIHALRPSWTYVATDDGGTVVMQVQHQSLDGGTWLPDGGATVVLQRTDAGFVGATWATVYAAQGAECSVAFPTEVKGCPDGGILLWAVDILPLDEACRAARTGTAQPRQEHLLLPAPALPPAPLPPSSQGAPDASR